MRMISELLPLCVWNSTKVSWMKCRAHRVFHSCPMSRSKSVCAPNSLRHRALKGAWVTRSYLCASGPHAEKPTCFFFTNDDVINRDFLNTRFIHAGPPPERGAEHQTSPSPWQLQPRGSMWAPFLLLFVVGRRVRDCACTVHPHVCPCKYRMTFRGLSSGYFHAVQAIRKHTESPMNRPASVPGSAQEGSSWWVTVLFGSINFHFSPLSKWRDTF